MACPAQEVQADLNNTKALGLPSFAGNQAVGSKYPLAEGYLYPGYYSFKPAHHPAPDAAGHGDAVQDRDRGPEPGGRGEAAEFTEFQVITEASLLKAEVGSQPKYYPDVARVIDNRLNQADGPQAGQHGRVRPGHPRLQPDREQLHENSPYNTNLHDGLPPGPIDSPDVAAIQAVLHPAPRPQLAVLRHHEQGRPDEVHQQLQSQFHDLEQRSQEERGLISRPAQHGGRARLADRHSLSPVLHRAAYRELGLPGWDYEAIECDEAGLPGLLDSLGPDWAGLSLTMPLKRAVLPLLDEAEPLAAEVGGGQHRGLRRRRRASASTPTCPA